jgi:deoxyribonuclease-4
LKTEKDILKLIPPPETPPERTPRRIGIHTSTARGVEHAAERAYRLGCSTFQVFSSSPRQWKPYELTPSQCDEMNRLRARYDLRPLVIHANYLINVAGGNAEFHRKSIEALRAEMDRAISLCAEYLVLHPGSFRGMEREQGVERASAAIAEAARPHDLARSGLAVLVENTAGAEYSLGGSFEQLSELLERLRPALPVAVCIDTCHTHVAGYDIVSETGYQQTMRRIDAAIGLKNVPVWHCNDAKAPCGSHLDRHQHVGKGTIGLEAFRCLLNDPRTADAAFIAETPIDDPLDDLANVNTLKSLVATQKAADLKPERGRRLKSETQG